MKVHNTRFLPLLMSVLSSFICAPAMSTTEPFEITSPSRRNVAWIQELELTTRQLLETHPEPFHHLPRARWDAEVAALREAIPELDDHEIVVRLMQLVAAVGDGHTRYDSENGSHGFDSLFPIIVYPFADGLHVLAAIAEYEELVGARIVRYGTVEPKEALRRVGTTISADNASGVLRETPYALQRPAILHALDITSERDILDIEILTDAGDLVTHKMTAIAREDDRFQREQLVVAGDRAAVEQPLYLRHAPVRFHWLKHPQPRFHWYATLETPRVMYAQINRVRDAPDSTFADFCREMFDAFEHHQLERLIIDLRHCPGGNNTLLRPLIHGIIRRDVLQVRGNLFVVTGRHTFSAAMNLVTRIERETRAHNGSTVIVVGEAPSGAPNHFGDAKIFYHFQTDLTLLVSEYRWQDSVPWDARRTITPHLPAELRMRDVQGHRDPAFEAIRELITASP